MIENGGADEPRVIPDAKARVPPPLRIYAAGGALLGVVLVALIVEFFLEAHRSSAAAQIVVGVAVVIDLGGSAWLLAAAERQRRLVYQWRSEALELVARYVNAGRYAETDPARPQLQQVAIATREQVLFAEAALRDAGAYAAAGQVGDARRAAGLVTDVSDNVGLDDNSKSVDDTA